MNIYWTEKSSIVAIDASIMALTEILDATIVSISIPNIMGSTGANTTQASWVLTSYVIAAAIFMPMAGLFAKKFGRKQFLLTSTVIFGISSVLCCFSTSLTEIIVSRSLEGMGGAFLPTLAQAYIVDYYEDSERPKIMSALK